MSFIAGTNSRFDQKFLPSFNFNHSDLPCFTRRVRSGQKDLPEFALADKFLEEQNHRKDDHQKDNPKAAAT